MTAWSELADRTFTPLKMTAIDWVLWNGRNQSPQNLLEQAAAEHAALRAERDELLALLTDLDSVNKVAKKDGMWSLDYIYQRRIDAALGVLLFTTPASAE